MNTKRTVNIDKKFLEDTYNECDRNINKTAKKLGISSYTIRHRLIEFNIPYDKTKYQHNESVFDELNEESMYWLGFLATDGNVYKNRISLRLATKDGHMVEKFKKFLQTNAPIINSQRLTKNTMCFNTGLRINSQYLTKKLSEYGIIPNKTFIYKLPDIIKNHLLVHHFIRGCIDGDGSIIHNNTKNKSIHIFFCGASSLVIDVLEIIKSKCNLNKYNITIYKKNNTLNFKISNHHDVDKIIDWLYHNASIYLERKYENAKLAKYYAENSQSFHMSKEELQQLYKQYRFIRTIATKSNIDQSTIKKYLLKYNIIKHIKYMTKEEIIPLCFEYKTILGIAKALSVSRDSIRKYLQLHSINLKDLLIIK